MISRRCSLFVLLCAVGCGQPAPPAADPTRARATLQVALEAWQQGESAEALKARSPAIYFNEPACKEGNRLIHFEITTEEANGFNWRCNVLLTVQSADGKPKQRKASYLIDTDPALVIVRDSMQ
jgi:hypothetical protein